MQKKADSHITELMGLLTELLACAQPSAYAKLERNIGGWPDSFSCRQFFYLFSICSRWFDSVQVQLQGRMYEHLSQHGAQNILAEWQYPQLARLWILLTLATRLPSDAGSENIQVLFNTADVNERILLGQSLAFLPDTLSHALIEQARESARSNIVPVFSSIAHQNDFACRFFDEDGWNQLVLKAAFLEVPIWSIVGLKQRNNRKLTTMLAHYVRERRAAGRSLPWDLWCCMGWLAQSERELDFLQQQWRCLQSAFSAKSLAAIALALSENPQRAAQSLSMELFAQIHPMTEPLNWPQLAAWAD